MTRAKDISKIVTDADLSGTLDVTGTVTVGGNVGIGTVPSDWNTFTASLQIDGASLSGLGANNTALASNAYYNSGWKYYGTGRASLYQQNSGLHRWDIAGSGTAGNTIAFTEAMRIDSSGKVGIGTSSPDTTLHITGDFDNSSSKAGNNANKGLTITSSASGTTSYARDNEFGIVFAASDGTSGDAPTAGIMTIPVQSGSYVGGHLVFQTHTSSDSTLLERMRITSGGDFQLYEDTGTTAKLFWKSAEEQLSVQGAFRTLSTGAGSSPSPYADAALVYHDNTTEANPTGIFFHNTFSSNGSSFMSFRTRNNAAAQERMRIDSSGTVQISGPSGASSIATDGTQFIPSSDKVEYRWYCGTTTSRTAISFRNPNGQVGTITVGGTSTSFNTSSDHRLKENVVTNWDATTRLKQLNPVRFNFIADADITVDGFLAHEVQSVVPEAITGTHNEVDDDGNPVYQGIDQSKLVPLLVKTIQELEARITALESE